MYCIHLGEIPDQSVSENVIVVGNKPRAIKAMEMLTDCKVLSEERGAYLVSGYYHNKLVSICCVGMGGPSMAIMTEELISLGTKRIIRVGSCGVFKKENKPGDIFIATGAVRHDGTSSKYLPLEFPAIPDLELTNKLIQVSREMNVTVHAGLGSCNDIYYKFMRTTAEQEMRALKERVNVLFGEMENATLFTVGMVHQIKTASMVISDSTVETKKDKNGISDFEKSEITALKIALHAICN